MYIAPPQDDRQHRLQTLLQEQILILDGAMGTMVQALHLEEADVRGRRFASHPVDLKNFPDILCLTQPDAIREIHAKYYRAGADIVTTNTFGASPVGMEEFQLPAEVMREINAAAVRCARAAAEEIERGEPGRSCFVAASIGPTAKQLAISTKVEDPAYRNTTYDQMAESYYQQASVLIESGADILLAETVIDTLNLKACLFGIQRYFDETGRTLPVMASATFDPSGRTFVSAQTVEAMWNEIGRAHV